MQLFMVAVRCRLTHWMNYRRRETPDTGLAEILWIIERLTAVSPGFVGSTVTPIKIWRSNRSRCPSESAGFDLLDFLYPFPSGMEPNADIAVTLSKLRRQVLDCRSGLSGRLQGSNDLLLQWSTWTCRFGFRRYSPATSCDRTRFGREAFFPFPRCPPGLHGRREFRSGRHTEPSFPPRSRGLCRGGLSAYDPIQFLPQIFDLFPDRDGLLKLLKR